jgi:hypothetical protein
MRRYVPILASLIALPSPVGAATAQTLMDKAELWGELHGAAIYCHHRDTDAFGRAAMAYFKHRAHSAAEFRKLNDAYGLKAVRTALDPPSRAVGGNCAGHDAMYRKVWKILRAG